MRVEFEQVSLWGQKKGKCACGKIRTRSTTIVNTINPYNKNAKGVPKTRKEVEESVKQQLEAWKTKPIYCANCEPKASS